MTLTGPTTDAGRDNRPDVKAWRTKVIIVGTAPLAAHTTCLAILSSSAVTRREEPLSSWTADQSPVHTVPLDQRSSVTAASVQRKRPDQLASAVKLIVTSNRTSSATRTFDCPKINVSLLITISSSINLCISDRHSVMRKIATDIERGKRTDSVDL